MSKDGEFMALALAAARRGMRRNAGGPFGACITKSGKLLAVAYNRVLRTHDPTCHAEINAIRQACRQSGHHHLKGATIYTTTEPCVMCFAAIHWARIGRIVYGSSIREIARLGFNELRISNQRLKSLGKLRLKIKRGFMHAEAKELLDQWQQLPKRTVY